MQRDEDWPLRAAFLALLGLVIGLSVHFLLRAERPYQFTEDSGRLALAALLTVGGTAYAFVVERDRPLLSLGFAALAGLVVGSTVYWSGCRPSGWDGGESWRVTCALLTVAIAAPLFQAWRAGGGRIAYVDAHNRAWTNVLLWFASLAFTGIVWILAWLLASLFDLIGIHALAELLQKPWCPPGLTGLGFGGAVGLLRDRERLLGTLQRVATTVLMVLAPVLAVGLLAFLIALPFTGLSPLWGATKSTTPILISCVIGALLLANAVIGDAPGDERRGVLGWAAMGLSVAMLPLAVIAAVSTGLRIGQYGLAPDRLWAVVFAGIACAYGVAYLVSLVRGRLHWQEPVRAANLRLAFGLCGLAFILSTPLLNFGAIATRDQLARLSDGRTPAAKFDWAALRFDFGPAGKAAVERLAKRGATAEIRLAAAASLKSTDRWAATTALRIQRGADTLDTRLRILPKPVPLPADLRLRLAQGDACGESGPCVLFYAAGAKEAVVVAGQDYGASTSLLKMGPGGWRKTDPFEDMARAMSPAEQQAQAKADADKRAVIKAALARGDAELRTETVTVTRREVFVGGKSVGKLPSTEP